MKLSMSIALIFLSSANAFVTPSTTSKSSRQHVIVSSSSSDDGTSFSQGPRIIMDEVPIVYVYDHCPFCVRVRLALGVKNVKHNVQFLANDDITTPTKLVGKKIAPIFVSF